ncbi:MAG: Hpt domain-containing protein [Desulfohalobiaceae bacterium]
MWICSASGIHGVRALRDGQLDKATLQSKFQGKKSLLEKVLQEFSRSVQEMLPEMRSALDSRDWSALEHMAHTLKGNAALIGANRVVNLALALEQASVQEDAPYLDSWLPELEREAWSALRELRQFVENL